MIKVKKLSEQFVEPIVNLIEWNLYAFPSLPIPPLKRNEKEIRLKRLLDNLYRHTNEVENSAIYFLKQAIKDGLDNSDSCPVKKIFFKRF